MKEDIIRLWNEGFTSGDIAHELGVTRNTVMGAVHRAQRVGLAMKKDPSVLSRIRNVKGKPNKTVEERPKKNALGKRIGPAVVELPRTPIKNVPKTLMQLNSHDCRWVIKDGYFCAAPSESSLRPWCKDHYKMVYVPSTSLNARRKRDVLKAKFNFSMVH